MKRTLVLFIGLVLVLSSLTLPPMSLQADPIYSVSSIDVNGTTADDPGTGSATYDIDVTVNFIGGSNVSGATQDFEITVKLIRDDNVDAMANETVASTAISGGSHSNTYTLSTLAAAISYVKVVVEVYDTYHNTTKTAEEVLFTTTKGYRITKLNPSSVIVSWGGTLEVRVKDYNGDPATGNIEMKYQPTNTSVVSGSLTNGMFVAALNIDEEGDYLITSGIAKAVLKARYNFTLSDPTSPILSGDPAVVSGQFTDSDGNGVSGLTVGIYPSTDPTGAPVHIFSDPTTSSGMFAGVWSTTGVEPGTYYVGIVGNYRGHDYGTITIVPRDFSIQADVSEVYAGLPRTQDVTFTVYDHEGNPLASRPIDYVIKNNSTVLFDASTNTDAHGRFSITLPTGLDSGGLYVTVKGSTSAGIYGEANLTIPVTTPAKIGFNITGLPSPLNVDDYTAHVEVLSNIDPPENIETVTVTVEGPVTFEYGTNTYVSGESFVVNPSPPVQPLSFNFNLSAMGYGTVRITLDAKDVAGNRVVKSFDYPVVGYDASVTPTVATVGDSTNIVVTVKDPANGNIPVNNAIVRIVADKPDVFEVGGTLYTQLTVDGTTENIVGGQYVFAATLVKTANVDVFVYKSDGTTLMYREPSAITINPIEDLVVSVDPDKVIAGFTTAITVTVTASDGTGVDANVYLKDEDGTILDTAVVSTSVTSITLNLSTPEPDKVYEVYVLTIDENRAGRATIETHVPDITYIPDDNVITAGEEETITATILNPFTGDPLAVDSIELIPDNVTFTTIAGADSVSGASNLSYTFKADIIDTSIDAYITLKVVNEGITIVEMKLRVVPPELTVEPLTGYVGINNTFDITLTDAHGNPLAGRTIEISQSGAIVGNVITDENGQAAFVYKAMTTGILTFTYGAYASVDVGIQVDPNPPTIISVTPSTATVVHEDRLTITVEVYEGETYLKDVLARNVATGEVVYGLLTEKTGTVTVNLILRLEEGQNAFVILAYDIAGNQSDPYVFNVKYEPPVDITPPTIISITPADGSTVTKSSVRVALEIEDDTALDTVYVDYEPIARNLGVKYTIVYFDVELEEGENTFDIVVSDTSGNVTKMTYNLYYYDPTVEIVLRIGSQFYKVDGKTQIMDVAPFIDPRYGRTMVPLRFVAEGLGLTVEWNGETRTVLIYGELGGVSKQIEIPMRDLTKTKIKIGGVDAYVYESDGTMYIDGVKIDLVAAGLGRPMIYNNRTFVPIRVLVETFGCEVEWIPPDTVKILYTP